MTATLHVVPIGDLVEHTSEDDCSCGPTAEPIKATADWAGRIMIRHSLDGRGAGDLGLAS